MMNIVSADGVVHGLRIIKDKYKNTNAYYKFDLDILKLPLYKPVTVI